MDDDLGYCYCCASEFYSTFSIGNNEWPLCSECSKTRVAELLAEGPLYSLDLFGPHGSLPEWMKTAIFTVPNSTNPCDDDELATIDSTRHLRLRMRRGALIITVPLVTSAVRMLEMPLKTLVALNADLVAKHHNQVAVQVPAGLHNADDWHKANQQVVECAETQSVVSTFF